MEWLIWLIWILICTAVLQGILRAIQNRDKF